MFIRKRNGLLEEAVILALTGSKLRVALKNGDDVVECRLVQDTWITEDGEPVTFDFTMSILAAVGIVPPVDVPLAQPPADVPSLSLFDFPYVVGRAN
jgi:hypothetical protein